MSVIELLFILVVIGVGLYYLNTLPIAPPFKTLIYIVVVILAIVMVIDFFGLWDMGDNWHHRHYRR
jgi:hypothetical protein